MKERNVRICLFSKIKKWASVAIASLHMTSSPTCGSIIIKHASFELMVPSFVVRKIGN